MKKNRRTGLALVLCVTISLAGCSTRAAVADLESDKAIIEATGGDMNVINQEARAACAIHSKVAHGPISRRCVDQYCISAMYLYACK